MFVFIDISTYLIVSGTQTGPIVKFKSVYHIFIGTIQRDFALIRKKARPEIRSGFITSLILTNNF